MSYPIPEYLKDTYERAKFTLTRQLIERIAKLEADKKELLQALQHIADDGMDARQCMVQARAAIKQAKEQP